MPAVIFLPCLLLLAAQSLLCISKTMDAQTEILLEEVAEVISKSLLRALSCSSYVVSWAQHGTVPWCQLHLSSGFSDCSSRQAYCNTQLPAFSKPWRNHTKHLPSCINVAQGGKWHRHGKGEACSVFNLPWALGMFQRRGS